MWESQATREGDVEAGSTFDESDEAAWEDLAKEMNAWSARLEEAIAPQVQLFNTHTRIRRARRLKYTRFILKCIASRHAKAKGKEKDPGRPQGPPKFEWPQRDLLYNTDLFVPLNLELKGIEEEGDDLHGLLTRELQAAARTMGHNPSWPLAEKRRFVLKLKRFYEKAVKRGPSPHIDIFADHRHLIDDDDMSAYSDADSAHDETDTSR